MKLSKSLLQAMAVAVTVTTISACAKDKVINAKDSKTGQQQVPYNCPACGMG